MAPVGSLLTRFRVVSMFLVVRCGGPTGPRHWPCGDPLHLFFDKSFGGSRHVESTEKK